MGKGVSFWGLLFLLFLGLKLGEVGAVADWSWWLVTAPLWGPVALVLVVIMVAAVPFTIYYLLNPDQIKGKK